MNSFLNLSLTSIHAIQELELKLQDIEGYKIELMAIQPKDFQKISVDVIINIVATIMNCTVSGMKGKSRKREYVNGRQLSIYFIRQIYPEMAYREIGSLFGGRDHSTVMYSIDQVENHRSIDKKYRHDFEQIETLLKTQPIIN